MEWLDHAREQTDIGDRCEQAQTALDRMKLTPSFLEQAWLG